VIPVLIGKFVESGLEAKNLEMAKFYAISIIVVAIISAFFDLTMSWGNEIAANDVEYKTRSIYFRSIQGKTMAFHDEARLGEMMSIAQNDMRSLYSTVAPGFRLFGESIISIIVVLVFIFFESYLLGILFLILLPIWIYSIVQYYQRLTPIAIEQQQKFRDMAAVVQENLVNAKIVRSFSQDNNEIDFFNSHHEDYTRSWEQRGKIAALFTPMLATYILAGIMFICSVYLAINPTITIGTQTVTTRFGVSEFITVMGLMIQFRQPTFFVGATIELASLGFAGVEKVQQTIASGEMEQKMEGQDIIEQDVQGQVTFDSVTFGYNKTPILENIKFSIESGEVVAIVGPPGSGKTTLMKLLTRFYEPASGKILIDGRNVTDFGLMQLRRNIGVVEQDVHLFSTSIRENIIYGIDRPITDDELENVAKLSRIDEFIYDLPNGFNTLTGERGERLSGGQRQRVAIARALISDPKILILDDSTSAIDAKTEHEIVSALNELMRGRTSFLITNRLNMIRRADKILILNNGMLAGEGTHNELLSSNSIYQRIFSPHLSARVILESQNKEEES
jgi:ATP-binding cassette subfamily B protein